MVELEPELWEHIQISWFELGYIWPKGLSDKVCWICWNQTFIFSPVWPKCTRHFQSVYSFTIRTHLCIFKTRLLWRMMLRKVVGLLGGLDPRCPDRRWITLVRTTSRVWRADRRLHLPHTHTHTHTNWEVFGHFNIHQSVRGNLISHGFHKTPTHKFYLCLHTHTYRKNLSGSTVENSVKCPRSIFVTATSILSLVSVWSCAVMSLPVTVSGIKKHSDDAPQKMMTAAWERREERKRRILLFKSNNM